MRCPIHSMPEPCADCAHTTDFAERLNVPEPKTARGTDGMWLVTEARVVTPDGRTGRVAGQNTAGDLCTVRFRDRSTRSYPSSELRRAPATAKRARRSAA